MGLCGRKAPPGLLTESDREVAAIWVVAAVEWARAVREVRNHGQVVKTREGNAIQNPCLSIMNRQALVMLRAASELGFSPAARVGLSGSRAPEFGPPGPYRSTALAEYLARKPDRLDDLGKLAN